MRSCKQVMNDAMDVTRQFKFGAKKGLSGFVSFNFTIFYVYFLYSNVFPIPSTLD